MFNAFFMAHFIWNSIPVWKHPNWWNDHIWDIWPFGKNVKSHKKPSSTRSSSIFLPDLKKNPKNQMLFKHWNHFNLLLQIFSFLPPRLHDCGHVFHTGEPGGKRPEKILSQKLQKRNTKYKSRGEAEASDLRRFVDTIRNAQYAIRNMPYAIHNMPYAIRNMQNAIRNTQYTICKMQCAIHNMQCTIRNTQYNMQRYKRGKIHGYQTQMTKYEL